MPYVVDFVNVSTVGLESSPVAEALAGLRANEARYFSNKYDHTFTTEPAAKACAAGWASTPTICCRPCPRGRARRWRASCSRPS